MEPLKEKIDSSDIFIRRLTIIRLYRYTFACDIYFSLICPLINVSDPCTQAYVIIQGLLDKWFTRQSDAAVRFPIGWLLSYLWRSDIFWYVCNRRRRRFIAPAAGVGHLPAVPPAPWGPLLFTTDCMSGTAWDLIHGRLPLLFQSLSSHGREILVTSIIIVI